MKRRHLYEVIYNFLSDATKILFGSFIVGIFLPKMDISFSIFIGSIVTVITFIIIQAILLEGINE